jgi:hypothetical protein
VTPARDRSWAEPSQTRSPARTSKGLGALLHPEIELRALTPRRASAPENHTQVLEVLQTWFGDCEIEQVVCVDTDAFADRQRVAYRFRGHRSDGRFVIEQ